MSTPHISSSAIGGAVEQLHVIKVDCDTPGATLYYTLDGSAPELHRLVPPKVRAHVPCP